MSTEQTDPWDDFPPGGFHGKPQITEQTDLAKLRIQAMRACSSDNVGAKEAYAALDHYAEAYANAKLTALGIVLDTSGNERHLIPSALAKAQEDSKRLDWLEAHFVGFTLNNATLRGTPIRAAIDAARKESVK